MDRLEALVNTSSKVPATRSKLVDEEKISELLEQMRLAIPQDMRAAQEVIERKDAILNQAQVDARRVRREAEDEFATRLDQNELMAAARKRAEELDQDIERKATRLMEQAVSESRNSRADADAYVVQTLRKLENEMTSVLASVRKGLDALSLEVPV
jgi:hypothetical protein